MSGLGSSLIMAAILRTASGFCSHALPSCVQARMPLAPAASAARPSSDHASFKSTSCPGVSCSRSSVGFRAAGEEVHHSGCWTPAEKAPDSHGSLPQRGFRPGIGAKAGRSNGIKTTCSFGPGVCSRGSHLLVVHCASLRGRPSDPVPAPQSSAVPGPDRVYDDAPIGVK